MVSVIDAALAAQNMSIAAESMGLGICYIGGIRNNLNEVSGLLETPEYVLPLFGLVVGHPANLSDKKPRLPLDHIYHENAYQADEAEFKNICPHMTKRFQTIIKSGQTANGLTNGQTRSPEASKSHRVRI